MRHGAVKLQAEEDKPEVNRAAARLVDLICLTSGEALVV
jgi:hypothetical protein